MGNRSYLYLVPAHPQAGAGGMQVAEANNNFPSLWQLLLAEGDAAPAIIDQRVFGDAGTPNLAADAEPALQRLRQLADGVATHPQRHRLPALQRQFNALLDWLTECVATVAAQGGGPVKFSANLDQLSWLEGDLSPRDFIAACRAECQALWARVDQALRSGHHAALDEALGLTEHGGDFASWERWAWQFGFGGIEHDYFHLRDEPLDIDLADFVPEPRSWEDDLGGGFERFVLDGLWGVRFQADAGAARTVLAPAWEDVRSAVHGHSVWLLRAGLYGLACLSEQGVRPQGPPQFEQVHDFQHAEAEGGPDLACAIVSRAGQAGLLRADGSWLFEPGVDEIWPYQQGFAPFRQGTREGFIDRHGAVAIPAQFDEVSAFAPCGVAVVWQGQRAGLVDAQGQWLLPPTHEDLAWRGDVLAFLATDAGQQGLRRADGSLWLAPAWDELRVLRDGGLIAARRGALWAVLGWDGRERTPPRYAELDLLAWPGHEEVPQGLPEAEVQALALRVVVDRRAGVVNADGHVLVPIDYDEVEPLEPQPAQGDVPALQADGLVRVMRRATRQQRCYGVYATALGRELVPCQWSRVLLCRLGADEHGFLVAQAVPKADRERLGEARCGVLRANGAALFPTVYAWLGQRVALTGSMWLVAGVRQTLSTEWAAGRPVQAVRNEDGLYVWLHGDGRELTHEQALAERFHHDDDLAAALSLGLALRDGEGIAPDAVAARRWLALAAGVPVGGPPPPGLLGRLWGALTGGAAKTPDETPGPRGARPQGLVAAQYALSLMLSEGLGGPAQPDTARAWLEHGLAHGGGQDRALITQLAYLLSEAIGGPAHLARALTLYEQAAAMDDTTALHNLALAYQHGRGVRTHRGEALAMFRRAERLGDLSCAFHVGALLAEHAQVLQGAERRQCLDEAGYFLRKLLDQPGTLHEDDACAELAQICLMPEAAAHDPAQAEALLLRGAALENAACMQLLVDRFYANPASGRADEALARQWAERARQTH